MQNIRRAIFFSTFIFVGIFYFSQNSQATGSNIVINEIMIGQTGASKNEFIELYNPTNSDIDLTGYKLKKKTKSGSESNLVSASKFNGTISAQGYFLISHPDYQTTINADLSYSGISYSIAKNNTIILYNQQDQIIDKVGYGEAGDFESQATAQPENGQSIERQSAGQDTDDNSADFILLENPTPQNSNSQSSTESDNNNNNQNNSSNSVGSNYVSHSPGSIVINEIVSDPEDSSEWIELYNKTGSNIDLAGWYFEEGSETRTNLTGSIAAYDYLVIEDIKGNLNNNGDIIILSDYYNNIIDQVAYGNWDDGNINDNAPKANDPNSLGRIGNSQDTNNDLADFQITTSPTKNAANILIIEEEAGTQNFAPLKNKLIINEIFPNPAGSDEQEFIELKNISDEEINLADLIIGDNSKRRYAIKTEDYQTTLLATGELFIIPRHKSKIALNNTGGDKVILYDDQKNIIDEVEYTQKAEEGKSYALIENKWQWTDQPTSGTDNILNIENQPPVAVIEIPASEVVLGQELILDASDSYDPEGEELIIEWRVRVQENTKTRKQKNSERLYHDLILLLIFDEVGIYKIELMISDGELMTVEQVLINVVKQTQALRAHAGLLEPNLDYNLINEFMPNPTGSDNAEFIELYNPNKTKINLTGFFLDDIEGGSRPFEIREETIIEPFGYLIFNRKTTGLALNNTTDAARLLDSEKNILQQIDYEEVIEGASFARALDGSWFWTNITTAGTKNVAASSSSVSPLTGEVGGVALPLNQIREQELGDLIKTRGIVIVEQGILGTQIFYISGLKQNAGIQIYNYKKEFSNLKIGDEIEVTGVLSQSRGEYRIKVKQKEDIKILGHTNNVSPIQISISDIDEELEGSLAQVGGEIIEIKGSAIFLEDDSGEIKIYLKKATGIKKLVLYNDTEIKLKEGDVISAVGIVGKTTDGYRILPRYQDDIRIINVLGKELGENDNSDIVIKSRDNNWLKYLTATFGAVIVVLIIVGVKMRKG